MSAISCLCMCSSVCKPDVGKAKAGFHQLLMDIGGREQQQQVDMKLKTNPCSSTPNSCFNKRMLLASTLPPILLVAVNAPAFAERPQFRELEGSGGLKALDIRDGSGRVPQPGDTVAIHYYARLAAKQGWRFDSTYDHKDNTGAPEPFVFVIGSGTVIEGLDKAIQSMREGGVRRVIIPPSLGYQNTSQGPIPPNVFDRQRLYTTIFNPTRLANGEGSTLGTLIFDVELLKIRSN